MSKYLRLINCIKRHCEITWATPSQEAIISLISLHYSSHKVINIFGEQGSGKTFLGWLLQKNGYGRYMNYSEEFDRSLLYEKMVLDNAPTEKFKTRSLRSYLFESDHCKQLVLLTTLPVEDDVPKLQLHLTDDDKAKFKQNMFLYCKVQIVNEEQDYNLNKLLIANIKGED